MKFAKTTLTATILAALAPAGAGLSQDSPEARIEAMKGRTAAVQPKVVGGVEAEPGRWPWAGAMTFTRPDGYLFQYCGGTLVSAEWIVTAAHCDVRVGDKVVLGRHNLTAQEGDVIDVAEVINHEDYDPDTHDSDIALVRLVERAHVRPALLVDKKDTFAGPGDRSTVIGWGLLEEGGKASDTLQEVTVPVMSNAGCQEAYSGTGVVISDNMMCAGSLGQDSCQGDSGGGLFVSDPEKKEDPLAGVVSFGIGCARPSFFGVYTRVSQFRDWIIRNTGM